MWILSHVSVGLCAAKVWTSHHGEEAATESAHASLEALGMDYVDLLLVHAPVGGEPGQRLGTWHALEALQAAGKAKSIGVSNYGAHHIEEILGDAASKVVPAINQCELHPFLTRAKLVAWCRGKGIAFQGYCPLARCRKFGDARLAGVAKGVGKSEAQVMIRWALQHGYVTIPKSSSAARIKENAAVFDWALSEADMATLDACDEDYHVSWDPTTDTSA